MVTDRLLCLARAVSILIALSAARAQFTPATGSPFAAGANPVSVAVGDFNNDLIPDLAIANLNDKSVTVLLGTGMGGFMQAKGSPITVGTNPTSVAVADFNGDGFQDLAIANFGDGTITVLLGNGTGAFVPDPAQASPINVPHPAFIAAGNFNGNMGLAVANEVENTVTVLLGDGKGGFTPASSMPYNVGTRPVSLAIAPLTLAGIPDLAIANLDSGNITVLLGDGKGGFTPDTAEPSGAFPDPAAPLGTTPQVPGSPISVAILDVNHDSYPDLVIANEAANNITVLLGSATGGFTPATDSPIQVGSEPVSLATGDFNSDGIMDLAVVNYKDGTVTVLLGNPQGGFIPAPGSPYPVGALPHSVVVADFNGDGKPDLAIANEGGNSVTVLLNSFYAPVTVSAASGTLPVAPGSIVSIYGTGLAATGTPATALPLPTELGGTSVTITFSDNSQASLPLFYVGPTQINALIPQNAAAGAARLTVFTASGSQSGPVVLSPIAPALFSANETGQGVAAAQLITPLPNGFQTVTDVFQCPGGAGTCITVPVDLQPQQPPNPCQTGACQLVLYGTGLHNATAANLTVAIGALSLTPSYVGPSSFAGEDQVNVAIPATLAGKGPVPVSVSAAAKPSNLMSNIVIVNFQ
jgi:uncharacterized protein (TIGR03437 family)